MASRNTVHQWNWKRGAICCRHGLRQNKQLTNYDRADFGAARHNLDRREGQRWPASSTPTIVKIHNE